MNAVSGPKTMLAGLGTRTLFATSSLVAATKKGISNGRSLLDPMVQSWGDVKLSSCCKRFIASIAWIEL